MPTPSTVTSAELNVLLKRGSGPRMIDVHTPAEFETAQIPGAYNVPLDLPREHRDTIATPLDDDVVLDTRRGSRRWDLKSQVRLLVGSLVLGSVLRSIAAPARKAR
jgi:hypothetical protein